MHCGRADSFIEARSLATGRRKATFTGAGPQPSMFAWFQRSTHIRRPWAADVLCPHADTSETASRRQEQLRVRRYAGKISVEAFASELTVARFVVDRLVDSGRPRLTGQFLLRRGTLNGNEPSF